MSGRWSTKEPKEWRPWSRWKRFWWAFHRAWNFQKARGNIVFMTRQQERAFDRAVDKALEKALPPAHQTPR